MKHIFEATLFFALSLLLFAAPVSAQDVIVFGGDELSADGARSDEGKYTILNNKAGDPGAYQNIWHWRAGQDWGWGSYIQKISKDTVNSATAYLGWRWSEPDSDTLLPSMVVNNDSVVTNVNWTLNNRRNRSLNVGYNMWFHDQVQQMDGLDGQDAPRARISIWLHAEGDRTPLGTLQGSVLISGQHWYLYRHQANGSDDWDGFTFRARKRIRNAELALHEFTNHIVDTKKWMTEDRILSGVEFGCEAAYARGTIFQVEKFYIDVIPGVAPPEPPPARDTMYVDGRHLYSPTGEKVILRGVNEMFTWMPLVERSRAMREIGKSGANCARIVWLPSDSALDLDRVLTQCLSNKMIPMPELHGATGDISKVGEMVDYWTRSDVVKVLKKHEKWLILNIANEAGAGGVTDATFKNVYEDAITRIRNTGIKAPIVIDATQWGHNYQQIFRTWRGLRDHDPESNLMFSIHTYWSGTRQELEDIYEEIIQEVVSNNIPLHFGEGPQPTGFDCINDSPYQYALRRFHEEEIGWLAWSWGWVKNNDCDGAGGNPFDMTSNGIYGSWGSDFGRNIVLDDRHSLRRTAVRPEGLK